MEAENTQQEPVMTLRDAIPWKRVVSVKTTPVSAEPKWLEMIREINILSLCNVKKVNKIVDNIYIDSFLIGFM